MSLEQQLNAPISGVDELCHSKQNDGQYWAKCSEGNGFTADLMKTAASPANDKNEQNLKVRGNHESSAIEDNGNVPSGQAIVNEENVKSDEKPLTMEDHVVTDDGENVNNNSEKGHGNILNALNNEAKTIPVSEDKSATVDLHSTNEATPQNFNGDQLTPGTENKIAESGAQQQNHELTDDLLVTETCANNQPPGSMSTSNVDENEIEQQNDDDVASNEDCDSFSNEQHSDGDISDVADDYVTPEVENDEYILDTVLRKPRKKRRRIVSVNDDSDPENDEERERLLQSPTTMEANEVPDIVGDEEDIERLIQNEKPGPKSKKISTQKLKELQARELLRNAVVIPSSNKKKKSRIIDSDDDEEPLPYCVDVDDIGLPDTTEDNDNEDHDSDTLVGSSILLNDMNDVVNDIEIKPSTSSMENSIEQFSPDASNPIEKIIKVEPEDETTPGVSQCSTDIKCSIEDKSSEVAPAVKEESFDAIENETRALCDSGNSTDSTNQPSTKEEESHFTNVDFPPFSSSSSSEDGDEFIPNEIYFGTPDHKSKRSSRGNSQRTRGRLPQPSKREKKPVQTVARSTKKGRAITGRPARRENFIDNRRTSSTSGSVSATSSSDSDDEYEKSMVRRKPATITIVKQPSQLYHKGSLPVRRQPQPQQIQRLNQRKPDRFYDKSQEIPNSIYFGDVDVPLHVLHAYGDSDSDNAAKVDALNSKQGRLLSQVSRGRVMTLPNKSGQLHTSSKYQSTTVKSIADSRKARGRPKVTSVSPSSDQSIQMMKKCLKAAGLKKVKLNRLWEGCKSNSERADKMLELLREKGLEGEPTISKCKQLKVDYLTKKEIEDLDPNLIIQTEGRTRRSTRAATKRKYTYDEEEIMETRTKLRNVIDSDSDFE